ncbi:ArsR/SmtB family transcription factor [Albidovulum sediminicola]|uniref:Metalloregulator ArsR/SmtB family transcription factor n=1 Tax=Albidovulum sediminicola TaxID=2984331 RepID=A0ABT2Z5W0_9RHOB|nr:metalloregulator ArsR/SmtB family transcription factor [Defluviimonas sp. WL0075]MCV2866539.1 metalloregulator ArsR/SmtB family transcription factor [Defluviimonas sp. WL0075]
MPSTAREIATEPAAPTSAEDMLARATEAAGLLKALGHEGRLMILCYLSEGECSVSELEDLLGLRQAAVSQQLARLRAEGLVGCRRDGKTIYYTIADERAACLVKTLYELYCKP